MKKPLAIACFFLTGFSGLVYEIAWIKQASLVFGSTTWALSTVLGVFFGGLALGSWLFGRLAGRLDRPIRLYALVEISVAVLALVSLRAFGWIDGFYDGIYRNALQTVTDPEGLTWLSAGPGAAVARIGLVALVLLPPTILMGGSLPLFCRQFVASRDRIAGSIGLLYGVNTLGGALGTLAAGFILIPRIGVASAVTVAAGLNLLAGLTAVLLPFRAGSAGGGARGLRPPPLDPAGRRRLRTVSALFFVTGLVAIAAEILWSRFLSLLIRNSIYTYTITLGVVLLGVVLGSLLSGRLVDRLTDPRRKVPFATGDLFAAFQVASALLILILMFLPAGFWRGLGQGLTPFFLLMLPPAILSGASFPLASRLVLEDPHLSAGRVGRLTALNTVGGITGSLLVGFYLLPHLGLAAGVRIVTLCGLLSGGAALWLLDPPAGRRAPIRTALSAAAVLVWLGAPLLTGADLPADYLGREGRLIDFAEGSGSSLAAVDEGGNVNLQIDNLWQGSSQKGHQIMAAHVPALLHPQPDEVLVVGVGVGQTAGRFLMHGVRRLDCVDIEPAIFSFIAGNFETAWMTDPRVRLIPDDGRTYVAHGGQSYDLISVEVGQVFRPGVDAFYTREFYEAARRRLNPGGILAQFVSLSFLGEQEFRSVLATFLAVFPEAVLWYNTQEHLLIGGRDGQPRLDLGRLASIDPDSPLGRDLAWSHWDGPAFHLVQPGVFLGGFLTDGQGLARLAARGSIYGDDLPALAYATAGVQRLDNLEKPLVPLLKETLAPFARVLSAPGGSAQPWAQETLDLAARTRDLNLQDILASALLAGATDQQNLVPLRQTLELLQRALKINPHSYLARANAGKLLLLGGDFARAEPFLRQAVEMRPELGTPRRDLGFTLLRTDRAPAALPELEVAARLIPRDAQVHNYLGTALALTGNLPRAVAEFERARDLDPQDTSVLQNLDRARRDLQKVSSR